MDQEAITLEVDPRSVLAAIKQANTAVEGWEQGTVGAGDRMRKSIERMGDMLLKINDRSRSSMERLTQSIEKQAAAYGKTGVDRLVADRDRLIKKLGDEQGPTARVTAAYAKMIDVESGKSDAQGAPGFQALDRNIESFVRDPLNASKTAATGLFATMGPVGTALGVGATALTVFAATRPWSTPPACHACVHAGMSDRRRQIRGCRLEKRHGAPEAHSTGRRFGCGYAALCDRRSVFVVCPCPQERQATENDSLSRQSKQYCP